MKSYTFLCIGDLHIKISSIETVRKVKEEIIKVIYNKKPDYIVILGDMQDTFEKVHLQAWNEIVSFIKDIIGKSQKLYYVVGNHDYLNNQVFMTDDHFFNVFKLVDGVEIVDKPKILVLNDSGLTVGFIPYIPPGRLHEVQMARSCSIIFGHQEFKGVNFGHAISEKGDEWPDSNPLVVSGHIHEHQWFKPNILYVGSPYQTNFGESLDKSISLITLNTDGFKEERIFLNIPKKISIEINAYEFNNLEINDFDEYRIVVSGTTEEIAALKKTKKFKTINEKAKLITKVTDKSIVKKNVANLGFIDLLKIEIDKESPMVKEIFKEVISEAIA
jgi:DNA repair exonuclease SbcCD nuclease subunit